MRISDWSSDVCSSDLCFACDRGDEARMAAVYLDDSWDEHGVYAARGPDFARIMSQAVAEQTDSMFHLLGQSQIRVDGDVAGADSYFLAVRSEEHTSELQSLMRTSYAVFCLKKKK